MSQDRPQHASDHQGGKAVKLLKVFDLEIRLTRPNGTCGPAQLNTHFEGVSDHGDKQDLVFSGLSTFLPRSVDSVYTVQRYSSQCLRALVGVTVHQNEIPSVAIIAVNPNTEPTPPILC
jgi:hypothetical protein